MFSKKKKNVKELLITSFSFCKKERYIGWDITNVEMPTGIEEDMCGVGRGERSLAISIQVCNCLKMQILRSRSDRRRMA